MRLTITATATAVGEAVSFPGIWLLRLDENLRSTWIYVKDNLVRHGLIEKAEDWPYHLDFINQSETGSYQLPLQFRGVGGQ